jgi:flagellar protein FlaG
VEEIELTATIHTSSRDYVPKVDSSRSNAGQKSERPVKAVAAQEVDTTEVIKQVDEFVKSLSTKISFAVDSRTGKQVIIVREKATGKIIRQIPPQEMLDLVAKMKEIGGIIFNGRV